MIHGSHKDSLFFFIIMFEFAEVGGAVRDRYLGIASDDVDFTVIADDNMQKLPAQEVFEKLKEYLKQQEFDLRVITPEFFTIRALVPSSHELCQRTRVADFVLARHDGPSSDGRRPDYVMPGTLEDDLSRRDFTVNALAIYNNEVIDLFGGVDDIDDRILRFVGDPMERILEDGLRVLRFYRFLVTLGFTADSAALRACQTIEAAQMVRKVSLDRIHKELTKMFLKNTVESVRLISTFPDYLMSAVFREPLHLIPSLKL